MAAFSPTSEQLSFIENRPKNLGRLFLDRVAKTPAAPAFAFVTDDEVWRELTWAQAGEQVQKLAAGLVALGIKAEQRVAIASNTRYEWVLADLAINLAAAATTTVYPSTEGSDVAYILSDSGSRVVFAEDDAQIAKIEARAAELPDLKTIVTFDGTPDGKRVLSWSDLQDLGAQYLEKHPDVIEKRVASIKPTSLAMLIYTSGTTGRPKGVRLTHTGWTYEGAAIDAMGWLTADDVEFRWLPLSHSFGKVLSVLHLQVGYKAAIDGRVPKIVDNLAVVRPTFMGAAPRIFEKAYGRIVGMVEEEGGVKLKLFRWAEKVGRERFRLVTAGKPVPLGLKLQHALADKLVFSKIRTRFGGRVRFFISGAAALSAELAEWFHAAGVPILEGYGMTENSAGATLNHPAHFKIGTVGLPFPGSAVKIAKDGEVLIKGPHVMSGYHNLDEATAETLLRGGWLATGDIGEIDADGFLKITDRKKDLFKTSGGKYVAPSHVEGLFKAVCPLASQMLVHGNERNFCSALITLDPDAVASWAGSHGMAGKAYEEVVGSPQMHEVVTGYVDELNARLNRWESIRKFQIMPADFTVEGGQITPSLKLKRKAVEAMYQDILNGFYAG